MESRSNQPVNKIILALGGNQGDTLEIFSQALKLLSERIGGILKVSSIYQTKALNLAENAELQQPDYLNAACVCESKLSPDKILDEILSIEAAIGRDRAKEIRWGPRVIDIDVLDFNNSIYSTDKLIIPHPELHKRDFVLIPLRDVSPQYIHPLFNLNIDQMINNIELSGGEKFVYKIVMK